MIRSVTQLCNERAIGSWQQHLRAIGRSEGTIEQYSSYVVRFLRGRSAYAATLDDVEEAFHKMERGEVLRSVVVL